LIRQTGTGVVVEPDDVDGIKEALVSLVDGCRSGGARPSGDRARYEWQILAKEFDTLLAAVGGGGQVRDRSFAGAVDPA